LSLASTSTSYFDIAAPVADLAAFPCVDILIKITLGLFSF
jgi:hypothetical protein